MPQTDVYLGLGSNIGDRAGNLTAALRALSPYMELVTVSNVYETEPVGFDHQPHFLNLVCHTVMAMSPGELLHRTQAIEAQLGRRPAFRNGPRVIDIDILLYGNICIHTEKLEIPHPGIPTRSFVLAPLAEIAPDFVHPTLQKTIKQLLRETPDHHWVRAVHGGDDVPVVR